MYTNWQHNYGAIPLPFTPLANSLLLQSHSSFTYLETLLGVIRFRPPWPQVTPKLTSPFPSLPHSLPIPNSRPPGVFPELNMRLTKTTSQFRLQGPEHLRRNFSLYWADFSSGYPPLCTVCVCLIQSCPKMLCAHWIFWLTRSNLIRINFKFVLHFPIRSIDCCIGLWKFLKFLLSGCAAVHNTRR